MSTPAAKVTPVDQEDELVFNTMDTGTFLDVIRCFVLGDGRQLSKDVSAAHLRSRPHLFHSNRYVLL